MNKEFSIKQYTLSQKIMMGLITLVVTVLPILFWMWIASYLTHSLTKIS
jgi:hypothetical protein